MLKKTCLFILLSAITGISTQASYIANRDFLSVGQGARANGMGEAFVAVADDATAMFWNPAGLTQLRSDEFLAGYADRFEGLADETNLHYAWRTSKAMWGAAYIGSYVTDIPVTSALTDQQLSAIQTGAFQSLDHPTNSVLDHAVMVSYARPLTPDSPHSLGTTVKVIYRDLLGMVRGYGTAVDLGYHYLTASGNSRLGVNVQNAASLVSYVGTIDNINTKATATESYIPNIKAGFAHSPSWKLLNGKILAAFDVNMLTSFDVEDYRVGIEYAFGENVALRGGKIFSRQEDSGEDYSLGMGVKFGNLILDFSFLSTELGQTTRGTIGYRLGGDYYTPSRY